MAEFSDSKTLEDTQEEEGKWMQASHNFASAVALYAKYGEPFSLYSSENFRKVAEFLNTPRLLPPHHAPYFPVRHDSFELATIHDFSYGFNDPRRTTYFSNSQVSRLAGRDLPKSSGQMLVLRGFPSATWFNMIGAKYHVDPEIFRRQLSFRTPTEDYFDFPGTSSSSYSILKLNLTSIGRISHTTVSRAEGPGALQQHFEALAVTRDTGSSIVRGFNWHDEKYFSIEQHIHVCVVECSSSWICILLFDNGRELSQGPWFSRKTQLDGSKIFLPVTRSGPIGIFGSEHKYGFAQDNAHVSDVPNSSVAQSTSLLHGQSLNYGLDSDTMASDPFYALHNLYAFSAVSESQFLSMVQVNLDIEYTHFSDALYMQQSLANLKYQKEILNDHIQQLQANLQEIKRRGCSKWPKPRDVIQRRIADNAAAVLLEDYYNLLKWAKRLSRECAEGMEDVHKSALLAESKKAIIQASGVGRLTTLAFFFLPFSFTTGFFGMNFKELGTPGNELRLWIWFVVSLPIFGIALLMCFWDVIRIAYKPVLFEIWRNIRRVAGFHRQI